MHGAADAFLQFGSTDLLLHEHKALETILFHVFWDLIFNLVRCSAFNGRILKAAHAIELCFFQPIEQDLEILFSFAREAHDKGGADHQFWADFTPFFDAL
ncbi:Uncharacterised protein [Vibrio cholerae]|nr:Uncharacterised protein [Vibrio cholerae]